MDGLIVLPLVPQLELDVEQLKQSAQVEGEWFPLQVPIEELMVVVDDDGSIAACTLNFPPSLVQQVRQTLIALAHQLYQAFPDETDPA